MSANPRMDPVANLLGGGRTVGYKTDFALAFGGATVGLLLSQFWFWTNNDTSAERDGWFWKTQAEITEETGLTRTETENARKKLVALKIMTQERRGNPAKLWFHIDKDVLYQKLLEYVNGLPGKLKERQDRAEILKQKRLKKQQQSKENRTFAGKPQTRSQETPKQDGAKARSKSAGKPQTLRTEITPEKTKENIHASPRVLASLLSREVRAVRVGIGQNMHTNLNGVAQQWRKKHGFDDPKSEENYDLLAVLTKRAAARNEAIT